MSAAIESTGDPRPAGRFRSAIRRNLRWQVPIVLLIGTFIAFIDRANLGVAAPQIQDDLDISGATMGIILGSYALVLSFVHPLAGWLVDKLKGPRFLYFFSAMCWFVFTTATALVRGAGSLLAVRTLLAAGEAPQASCALKATSRWFPRRERALAVGTYEFGSEFGAAMAVPIVAALIGLYGWRAAFVITGMIGLAFALFWLWFYRDPHAHKKLTADELAYIRDGGAHSSDGSASRESTVRWADLLRYRSTWGLLVLMFCRTSVNFFFLTWYPTYLVDERELTLLQLGLFGALPGLAAMAANPVGGWMSDRLYRTGHSLTFARKLPIAAGLAAATVIALVALVPNAVLAVALLSVASAGIAFCTGGSIRSRWRWRLRRPTASRCPG